MSAPPSAPSSEPKHTYLPLVSCTVLSYNNASIITDTLDSVLAQDYSNTELLIIDDCSTDDSVAVIKHWIEAKEVNCRFVVHRENRGITYSVQEAVDRSRGEWLAMVGDDVWKPQRLNELIQRAAAEENLPACVYSDCTVTDLKQQIIHPSYLASRGYDPHTGCEGFIFDIILRGHNPIAAPAALFRKAAINAVGGYDTELTTEDRDMALRLTQRFPVAYVNRPLVNYRRHGNSVSRRGITTAGHRDRLVMYAKVYGTATRVQQGYILKRLISSFRALRQDQRSSSAYGEWMQRLRAHYPLGALYALLLTSKWSLPARLGLWLLR